MDEYDAGLLAEARAIRREADAINRFVDDFLAIKYGGPGDTPPAAPAEQNGDPAPYVDTGPLTSGPPAEQNGDPPPYLDEGYGNYRPPNIKFEVR